VGADSETQVLGIALGHLAFRPRIGLDEVAIDSHVNLSSSLDGCSVDATGSGMVDQSG
jgi:hypothetical protein